MKTLFKTVCFSALTLSAALLLTQCAGHRTTVRTAQFATPTATGNVSVQTMGDTTVATRRLIHHPLTNKDIGKVYEEITIVSPPRHLRGGPHHRARPAQAGDQRRNPLTIAGHAPASATFSGRWLSA